MQLNTSYKQILSISIPIMLGSATQNIIALSDSVFLYHLSETDFAAIGFVGVFYLIIASIGYAFSKGGQILIARRYGENNRSGVSNTFYSVLGLITILSVMMFMFMEFASPWFFGLFIDSEVILEKSLEYLDYRSWGVFFSYAGVVCIALYTGIAKTSFIIVDALILAIVNIALNYALIFGHWGMPQMGIAGAGLASSISEVVAVLVFFVYMLKDRFLKEYHFFHWPAIDWKLAKDSLRISLPIVAQSIVGLGSWFFFFGIVENLGERQLAVTNLVRIVYLILSIPCWGYATGINTLVSNFIGNKKRFAVIPLIWKTTKLSALNTLLIALPVLLSPEFFLYPLLGGQDPSLIHEAQPIFYVLLGILLLFSTGSIYFNGMIGTGASFYGLKLQFIGAVFYVVYVYLTVNVFELSLTWAWAGELLYWAGIGLFAAIYLGSLKWHKLSF